MELETIPVNRPRITESDIEAVTRVLKEGWISGDSPEVERFEEEFSSLHNCRFGVAVPNGTIALDLLFSVLEIGPGDEVILPSFAIISCLSQVLRLGATPVFVDSEPLTWNMDASQVRQHVTEKTKAILVVHTYGLPADMDPLIEVASEFGLMLIEDSAESHGLAYKGVTCGGFGLASTFSFYANKNVTTGEGGMICTRNEELFHRLRYFRNLTFDATNRFVHSELGWNYRFTGIQAALGRSQLKRLGEMVLYRRRISEIYQGFLEELPGVKFAPSITQYAENDYWVSGLTIDKSLYGSAQGLRSALGDVGVATRPFFYPLHRQPAYMKSPVYRERHLPVADWLYDQGLYLPNGLGLELTEVEEAARRTRKILIGWGT